MSSKKLFVANLPYSISETQLSDLFQEAGTVESVKIIKDNMTGRSRGFGFIEMATEEEARQAIEKMNDHECDGRKLKVDIAATREGGPRTGGSRDGGRSRDGGSRGGYGSRGGNGGGYGR
ncbi:MAG: RNA-binding protein [bacterium]